MASSQDTEITLGTGKLLVLFFGLVGICALFFALGYSLGRKSEPTITSASAAVAPLSTASTNKTSSGSGAAPAMTFYKAVEQKDANPQLTPAADAKTDTTTAPAAALPLPPIRLPRCDVAANACCDRSRSDDTIADVGILRAGGCRQQARRCGLAGGRAEEEAVSGVCGGLGGDRQIVSRAGRAVLRCERRRGHARALDRRWI